MLLPNNDKALSSSTFIVTFDVRLVFFVSASPLHPFHCFMLRGCHSSIKATNGTRKTFKERIVVHPQVCSLFLLKALELGILHGLSIESAGYAFYVAAIVTGLQTYLFYNPHF